MILIKIQEQFFLEKNMSAKMNWGRVYYEGRSTRYRDQETINVYDSRFQGSISKERNPLYDEIKRAERARRRRKLKKKKHKNQAAKVPQETKKVTKKRTQTKPKAADYILVLYMLPQHLSGIKKRIAETGISHLSIKSIDFTGMTSLKINEVYIKTNNQVYKVKTKGIVISPGLRGNILLHITGAPEADLPAVFFEQLKPLSSAIDNGISATLYEQALE